MSLLDLIFPKQCILCSKIGSYICKDCLKNIPRTLPSCCICNRLSPGNLTHHGCSDIEIRYYCGWYLNKNLKIEIDKRKIQGFYLIYLELFYLLLEYLKISNILEASTIIPFKTNIKVDFGINKYIVSNYKRKKRSKEKIVFVTGNSVSKGEVLLNIKGLRISKPFEIYLISIFQTNP